MDLDDRVVATIRDEKLIAPGDRVVVGVSGGPDSLCLLHVLWQNRRVLEVTLHVAHLNHMLRGLDADEDARFVAAWAEERGLACHIASCDVAAHAQTQHMAIEEAARRVRYAFLADVAHQVGARRIAVAHNADDQSETVLMHWLRGAGLAGLRGMLPAIRLAALRLSVPAECASEYPECRQGQDTWLIRPLLSVPRAEIEQYCQKHGLRPRFDRSNLDTTLYRNKLRHELLPYLEGEYKPGFGEILRRSARVIRDDYDLLRTLRDAVWQRIVREEADGAIVLDRAGWRALHPALQRATVRHAVQRLRRTLRDVNFEHVEAAVGVARDKPVGAQATLPQGVVLTVGYDTIVVADAGSVLAPEWPTLQVERVALQVPGTTPLPGGGCAAIEVMSRGDLPADWANNDDPWCAYLDADVVGTEIHLRRRCDGDRFCPLGMRGRHKLVNELLVNEKVPAQWRDQVPLLVRSDGQIAWVCGWRVDDRAKVADKTTTVTVIRLRPAYRGLHE